MILFESLNLRLHEASPLPKVDGHGLPSSDDHGGNAGGAVQLGQSRRRALVVPKVMSWA